MRKAGRNAIDTEYYIEKNFPLHQVRFISVNDQYDSESWKTDLTEPREVNVLGLVPGGDVFYKGNLWEIKRLLGLIGLEANTFIGEGETLDNFRNAGNAAFILIILNVWLTFTTT